MSASVEKNEDSLLLRRLQPFVHCYYEFPICRHFMCSERAGEKNKAEMSSEFLRLKISYFTFCSEVLVFSALWLLF
jgi:hypothetical protein